jgi:CRISPR-associated protein Cas2
MVVMIMENVPVGLRGELSRWLIEPKAGVFLGHITAMVRDRLWDMCCEACRDGGIIQMWSTNNEQRFAVRVFGNTRRDIVDLDGIQLVRRDLPPSEKV